MKNSIILIGIAMALLVAGCAQEKKEEVKTVEYYKGHKEELQNTLKKCNDNTAALENDPNCMNAQTAYAQSLMQLNFKPMTEEEKYKY